MFLVPDDFLLEPLSAIWNTPTPLRDKILPMPCNSRVNPCPLWIGWPRPCAMPSAAGSAGPTAVTGCPGNTAVLLPLPACRMPFRRPQRLRCRRPPTSRLQRHTGSAGPTAITGGCRMPFPLPSSGSAGPTAVTGSCRIPSAALQRLRCRKSPTCDRVQRHAGWAGPTAITGCPGNTAVLLPLPACRMPSAAPQRLRCRRPPTSRVQRHAGSAGLTAITGCPGNTAVLLLLPACRISFRCPPAAALPGGLPRHGSSGTLGWQKRNKCAILGID